MALPCAALPPAVLWCDANLLCTDECTAEVAIADATSGCGGNAGDSQSCCCCGCCCCSGCCCCVGACCWSKESAPDDDSAPSAGLALCCGKAAFACTGGASLARGAGKLLGSRSGAAGLGGSEPMPVPREGNSERDNRQVEADDKKRTPRQETRDGVSKGGAREGEGSSDTWVSNARRCEPLRVLGVLVGALRAKKRS